MGGKSKSQTIGYSYYMALFMGMGRGPMDELVQINVGGKVAWMGSLLNNGGTSVGQINSPGLFGGEQKEGGIQGPFRVLWGGADQTLPGPEGKLSGVRESIMAGGSTMVPAMRGVTTLWYDGLVCSMNPYPKEWKLRWRRNTSGWAGGEAWYAAKAAIAMSTSEVISYKQAQDRGLLEMFLMKGGSFKKNVVMQVSGNIKGQNGAHIIYECITNPEWGRGIDPTMLDENSFIYAANQLCAEKFGLCFFWSRQEDVDAFIQIVLDHIGGVLYTDRSTGLETLRLIRKDYSPDNLPTFSVGNGLLEILLDDSGSQDIAYNEVVVKYHDPVTDTDGEARAHNAGARIAQGSTNSLSKEYPGLPTKELAARVALRELIVQSAGLKKYKVRLDRSGWRIAPGMPFRIIAPERNIGSIILRAGEITDSSAQRGGDIQVSALEDVFSMPETAMVVPEDPVWVSPVTDPVPPDASVAFELSYYDLTKRLSQFDIPNVSNEDSYLGVMAAQPLATQLQFDLMFRDPPTLTWTAGGTNSFTGTALLSADIGPYDTELSVTDIIEFPSDLIGDSMMIGDERVRIDAYDPVLNAFTVARGVADTLPAPHAEGDRIWLPDDDLASNDVIYSAGEVVEVAAATRANSGVLLEEDYDVLSVEMAQRIGRPYPVADLRVSGVPIFSAGDAGYPEPVFTWASRNRVLQQDQLVGHGEGAVAEEEGTTYEVVVKSATGDVLRTEALPAGSAEFTYTAVMQGEDGSPEFALFDIRPVRDDLRPLFSYDARVVLLSGYGYGYGYDYGGVIT